MSSILWLWLILLRWMWQKAAVDTSSKLIPLSSSLNRNPSSSSSLESDLPMDLFLWLYIGGRGSNVWNVEIDVSVGDVESSAPSLLLSLMNVIEIASISQLCQDIFLSAPYTDTFSSVKIVIEIFELMIHALINVVGISTSFWQISYVKLDLWQFCKTWEYNILTILQQWYLKIKKHYHYLIN